MKKYFTPLNVVLAIVVAYVVWKRIEYNRIQRELE